MKVVVAIDSFKGCMSSMEAGLACKEGVLDAMKDAEVEVFTVADGGEGTTATLVQNKQAKEVNVKVTGPIGDYVEARYYITTDNTAILEMAEAAGLYLVPENLRNPMHTTTFGVGQMIKDAIDKGVKDFIVGIGGSATNDCGIGMLTALGFRFYNKDGKVMSKGAQELSEIVSIDIENVIPELKECRFRVACDVQNPLVGPEGCSFVFAPQKGAVKEDVEIMDKAISHFADMVEELIGKKEAANINTKLKNRFTNGVGAAGGLGYAFLMFLNARLMPGIDIVIQETGIEERIKNADLVITGEGKLDSQTVMGKTPFGIARTAKAYNVETLGVAGCIADDFYPEGSKWFDNVVAISEDEASTYEAMVKERATSNMRRKICYYLTYRYNSN